MYGMIYLIIDGTNDMEYVGQTTRPVEERFKEHMKSDFYIGRAIRAHGVENFVTAILKECDSKEELDRWEKHFIKSRDTMSPNGYNLREGGEGGGSPCTESREKNSAAKKGKPLSPEHCAKISEALTGVPKSPEHVAKVAAANTGKKRSPESCARMSKSHKGKKRSPEAVAKTAAANTGQKRSPESCARMSESHKGKKQSPEQHAKIATTVHSKSLFKNLVAELDARQISYKALSELMDMEKSYISRRMRGKQNFTDEDKNKLAEIFGKPIEYLLKRDEE